MLHRLWSKDVSCVFLYLLSDMATTELYLNAALQVKMSHSATKMGNGKPTDSEVGKVDENILLGACMTCSL